jgi:hypothetical protein
MDNVTINSTNTPFTALRTISIRQNGANTSRFHIGGIRVATSWEDAVKMGNVEETGNSIIDFSLSLPDGSALWTGTIDEAGSTVNVRVGRSIDLSTQEFKASFSISDFAEAYIGNELQVSDEGQRLYANNIIYQIRPMIGNARDWTVVVSNQGSGETSVDKNNLNVKVYPNPVSETLYIESEEKVASVNVYNLSGQKVLSFENPDKSISLSSLDGGIYFIEISGINNSTTVRVVK